MWKKTQNYEYHAATCISYVPTYQKSPEQYAKYDFVFKFVAIRTLRASCTVCD